MVIVHGIEDAESFLDLTEDIYRRLLKHQIIHIDCKNHPDCGDVQVCKLQVLELMNYESGIEIQFRYLRTNQLT